MTDTSVPKIIFGDTGIIIPAESDVLAGVQADMNGAFGGRLNPSLETPQGQLASSTAAIIGDKNDQFAAFMNQIDPDTAYGRMQDAIARIYFIDRLPALPTSVAVDCVGAQGTVIPVGATTVSTSGDIYSCLGQGVIPVGGVITLQFACTKTGPIPCPAGAIVGPYKVLPGWDTATNTADGIMGDNVESRADFEYRRRQSVALNAINSLQSIYANVFDVDGVGDVTVRENVLSTPITIGGVTLVPNSIYVAAVGGLDQAIAEAIWRKKSQGSNYNGNTSVMVTDPSGYSPPYPTYTVKFQRPVAQAVLFAVQIANTPGLPSDIVTQVQNVIIAAFAGLDGGPRARIGSTIYASRFYAPVSNIKSGFVEILSLLIGTSSPTLNAVTIGIDRAPTVTAANIAVTLV